MSSEMKIVGNRIPSQGGLKAAENLFDLVIALRGNKKFYPKGVYRFKSFKEKDEWMMKMLTR